MTWLLSKLPFPYIVIASAVQCMQHWCTANETCTLGDCSRALAQAKCKAGILGVFFSLWPCVWVDFSCMLIILLAWSQLYFETSASTKMGQIFGHNAENSVLCKHIWTCCNYFHSAYSEINEEVNFNYFFELSYTSSHLHVWPEVKICDNQGFL